MLTLLALIVLAALLLVGLVQAIRGRYVVLVVGVAFGALLFLPGILISIGYSIRDIDLEMVQDGGVIEVRNRGPIAFSHRSRRNPYGGRIHRFQTVVDTLDPAQEIGFGIWDVREYRKPNYSAQCDLGPGPGGLVELFTSDIELPSTSGPRCRGSTIQQRVFQSVDGDGPPTRLRCTISSDGRVWPCSMRVFYDGYELIIFLWDVPPEEWRAARDHVVALIDQSFRIVSDD